MTDTVYVVQYPPGHDGCAVVEYICATENIAYGVLKKLGAEYEVVPVRIVQSADEIRVVEVFTVTVGSENNKELRFRGLFASTSCKRVVRGDQDVWSFKSYRNSTGVFCRASDFNENAAIAVAIDQIAKFEAREARR